MGSYILHREGQKKEAKGRYSRQELVDMTTVKLREICMRERIINGMIDPLDREELIKVILRFRGVPEKLLIKEPVKGGRERLFDMLEKKIGSDLYREDAILIPAKITWYEGISTTLLEHYEVQIRDFIRKRFCESNVLLVDENLKICSVFNIECEKEDTSFYLTREGRLFFTPADRMNYFLLFFEKKESDYLYQIYYGEECIPWAIVNYYKVPLLELEVRKPEVTKMVLSIDFGTSNTTAGVYLDYHFLAKHAKKEKQVLAQTEMEYILSFLEESGSEKTWRKSVPTMVSVKDATKKEHILYHFGYDARRELRNKYEDESFSIFYEIKRWVGSSERVEEIIDKKGNQAFVTRKEIMKEFLLFIIRNAECQLKCRFQKLQITSPVKQNRQFQSLFQEILPEYEFDIDYQIDEGTAVVYHTIHKLMEKKNYEEGELYSTMILDCGGGTTDLSSCSFSIQSTKVSYEIAIDTVYENGDTNFGGDNLTYRIMQYIKILLVAHYKKENINIMELIPAHESLVYQFVDQHGSKKLYQQFEEAYEKAEEIIPTRFQEYENRTRKEYHIVRNNHYFLFDLAEKLKQRFYQQDGKAHICLGSREQSSKGEEGFVTVEYFSLAIWQNGRFVYQHEYPKVMFLSRELELLLRGDIYEVMKEFFEEFYQQKVLEEYSLIKLTGQSCCIGLFRDALKEFIPGKSIRFQGSQKVEERNLELKLACVKGAIQFARAVKSGIAKIKIHYPLPRIPYFVTALTHEGKEKTLISSLNREQSYGYLSKSKETRILELMLKDESKTLQFRYIYENHEEEYKETTYEEIDEKYAEYRECLLQGTTDEMRDEEIRFFVFASKQEWGFYVVPVMRMDTQLYIGKEAFYYFENNLWETDFFDGTR